MFSAAKGMSAAWRALLQKKRAALCHSRAFYGKNHGIKREFRGIKTAVCKLLKIRCDFWRKI